MSNENNVQSEAVVNEPSKGAKIWAGVKEWFRKKIVSLKRKPHIIPLVFTLITSIVFLICLRDFSITITDDFNIKWGGLAVFVTSLLSVLVLALFLSAFPKRKKPNYIFIALVFVFFAVMLGMDILYYINTHSFMESTGEFKLVVSETATADQVAKIKRHIASLNEMIAHMVMLGISALLLATLPLYSKLIRKINTKKEIESSQLNEVIDTSEE